MVTSVPGINIPLAQQSRAPGPYDEDYRSIARREQLAQILQQQALQPLEAGSYQGIQAPISPLAGIAKVLQGYLAGTQSDQADQARQDLMFKAMNDERTLSNLPPLENPRKMAQALSQANPPTNTPTAYSTTNEGPPVAQPQEPVAQAMPVSPVGGTQAPVSAQAPQVAPQANQMPMLSSDPQTNARLIRIMGPQEYAKQLAKTLEPTPDMKNIASIYGVNSPEYKAEMQKVVFKGGYVPGQIVTEGGALVPAGANRPSYIAPYRGIQQQVGANNEITSSVMPGYAESAQAIKEAEATGTGRGQAFTSPATKIDLNTGNTVGTTQADVMGLPTQTGGQLQQRAPVVTGISPVMQDIEKGLNEDWRKNVFTPTYEKGQTAQKMLESVSVLRNTNLQTGFGTETQANIASMLAAAGVKDAEKFATSAQLFQKEGSKALLNILSTQKGPQTDRDALVGEKTFVRLSDTPQAKDFTLDLAQSMALQDQRKAGYFQKAADMPQVHQGKLGKISTEWSKIEGSVFDMPIGQTPDGKPITMRQKYGIQ